VTMRRNARKLEMFSMWVMVLGVIALCQPWNLFLHSYGATIILAGLIMFNIFSRIKSPAATPLSPSRESSTLEH
jgi:hypothetical protein